MTSDAAPRFIDTHYHVAPDFYADATGRAQFQGTYNASHRMAEWTPEMSLEEMDRDGCETAVVTIIGGPRLTELPDATALVRRCNEFTAQMAIDHPGRFGFFATLPLASVEDSLKEIEYSLDVLKADGIFMHTHHRGKWLGDPHWAPLFDEMNRRKALLYTHPSVPEFATRLIPNVPDTVCEITNDSGRGMASLLFSGTLARCPDIEIIWSHGGGTVPSYVERFVELESREIFREAVPNGVMPEIRRFYYDVAQVANPISFPSLRAMVPLSQIIFGTDFPYRSAKRIADGLLQCGLSQGERRAIYRENVLKLLPRFRKDITA